MIPYLSIAAAVKILAICPGGEYLYRLLGERVYRHQRGLEVPLFEAGALAVKRALSCVKPGERVLDLGTGWCYKDALLYALTGYFDVHAFDVKHLARESYVRNYLGLVEERLPYLAQFWNLPEESMRSRLRTWRASRDLNELRHAAGISLTIAPAHEISYSESSLAFISSYCVLTHIDPETLDFELNTLSNALRLDGHMHHLIGYDDHFSFNDHRVSPLNYYRYGDRYYWIVFESGLQYQNRWLWSDYQAAFKRAFLDVVYESADITSESIEAAKAIWPNLATRFRDYSFEEIARIHSTVLLRKSESI